MKTIKLTEEQKNKLLEMCKVLFPEYDFTIDKFSQCFVTFGLKTKDLYEQHIHWFEFCMTHLRTKLNLHHDDMYLTTNPGIDTFKHPIDYLYKQFKNL